MSNVDISILILEMTKKKKKKKEKAMEKERFVEVVLVWSLFYMLEKKKVLFGIKKRATLSLWKKSIFFWVKNI
jgi:hypothetical protein